MSWAKFDDMLPSNRKWRRVVKRSPEAACLWVAAICYSARYLTDGRIAKAEIEEVAPVRQPEKLAALLVEEEMFEDAGDAWIVHDYLDHNPTAAAILAKREEDRERKAKAREKGSKTSDRGPDGRYRPPGQPSAVRAESEAPSERTDNGRPGGQTSAVRAESAPPSTRPSSATRPVPSRPLSSSSTSDPRPPPPTEPDDDDESGPDQVTDQATTQAIDAAVEDRYRRRLAEKGQVGDVSAWKAECRRRVTAEVAEGGVAALTAPPLAPNGTPMEGAAVAQRALAERNEARQRGESACEKCADVGVFEVEDGSVIGCDCVVGSVRNATVR